MPLTEWEIGPTLQSLQTARPRYNLSFVTGTLLPFISCEEPCPKLNQELGLACNLIRLLALGALFCACWLGFLPC
jgi:hypothetical protein